MNKNECMKKLKYVRSERLSMNRTRYVYYCPIKKKQIYIIK